MDYEMCIVFEGASSVAYRDYAVKMTAIENKEKFGEEAAQTLQTKCYLDNLLLSVKSEDMEVQLIKKDQNMPYWSVH